jgi:type IV pilus assembly protein PilA
LCWPPGSWLGLKTRSLRPDTQEVIPHRPGGLHLGPALIIIIIRRIDMLLRLRKDQEEGEGGFTLIELLVVVIIIGILAAIAIPTFLNQREKAWQKAAQSDLRNAAMVLEDHYSEAGIYGATASLPFTVAGNFKPSDGVVLSGFGNASGYCLTADHSKLTMDYVFRLSVGKPQLQGTGAGQGAACSASDGTAIAAS